MHKKIKMKSTFLFMPLVIMTSIVFGQQPTVGKDTLTWSSSQAISNNNQITLANQFITYGDKQIDWVQQNGEEIYSYNVTQTIGTWPDLDITGQIEFKVTIGERAGSIFFYRNSGPIKVRIDILRDGINQVPFEFLVSGVQKTN